MIPASIVGVLAVQTLAIVLPGLASAAIVFSVTPVARADELAGFNAALDATRQHDRAALMHLRAGNLPLALTEIARLRQSFGALIERYGAERRAAFNDKTEYTTAVVDIPLRIATAQIMIDFGRPDIAATSLVAVCRSLKLLQDPTDRAPSATCDAK